MPNSPFFSNYIFLFSICSHISIPINCFQGYLENVISFKVIMLSLLCSLIIFRKGENITVFLEFFSGFVNTILSLKIWEPLVRLCYLAYLLHPIIISTFLFNLQQTLLINHWIMVNIVFLLVENQQQISLATN